MAWVGRDCKEHLVPAPLLAVGRAADQAAQGPIQPGLECLQGWGFYSFSGQTGPVTHQPLSKAFTESQNLLIPKLNLPFNI